MDILSGLLLILGPALIGILTVPAFDLIKFLTKLKGKLPDWVQQLSVPLLAYVLTWLATISNTVLPGTLELFTADHVSGLLSAGIAFGIKAGQKADVKKAITPT